MSARGSGPFPRLRRAEPDAGLAHAAAGGSDRAFAALYERHRHGLYRTAMAVTMDSDDALDALRQAAPHALHALRRDGAPASATGWLYRVTRNVAIAVVGARRPHGSTGQGAGARSDTVFAVVEPDHLRLLIADVETLSEAQRTALVLRELQGLGYDEIASAMASSPEAVRQSVQQARLALGDRSAARERACQALRAALEVGDRRGLRGRRIRAHLDRCPPCATFANALGDRRAALAILFPLLPAEADAAVLGAAQGAGAQKEAVPAAAQVAGTPDEATEQGTSATTVARDEAFSSRTAWKGLVAGGVAAAAAVAGALAVGLSNSATERDDAVTRNTAPPATGRPGLPPPASGPDLFGDARSPLSGDLFAVADRGDRSTRIDGRAGVLGLSPDGDRFASIRGPLAGLAPSGRSRPRSRSGPSRGEGPSGRSGPAGPRDRSGPTPPSGGGAPAPPRAPSGGPAPAPRPDGPPGGGPSDPNAPSGGGAPSAPASPPSPPSPPPSAPSPSGSCAGPLSGLACAADGLTNDALRLEPKLKPLTDPLGL